MNLREHGKYLVTFLIAIALVIFVIVLVLQNLGGDSTPANDKPAMTEYINTDSEMSVTAYGPIVADEDFKSARITVSSSEVTIDLMRGYNQRTVNTRSYPSNGNAYNDFVRALSILNFNSGNDNEKLADETGYCPTGNRYVYEITENNARQQRYWSGSCTKGTFRGLSPQVRALFKAQVPDYTDVLRDTPDFSIAW